MSAVMLTKRINGQRVFMTMETCVLRMKIQDPSMPPLAPHLHHRLLAR